jgi:hypothetical protein
MRHSARPCTAGLHIFPIIRVGVIEPNDRATNSGLRLPKGTWNGQEGSDGEDTSRHDRRYPLCVSQVTPTGGSRHPPMPLPPDGVSLQRAASGQLYRRIAAQRASLCRIVSRVSMKQCFKLALTCKCFGLIDLGPTH